MSTTISCSSRLRSATRGCCSRLSRVMHWCRCGCMFARGRLAVTAGDPRGIGPEIIRRARDVPRVVERCDVLVVGPTGVGLELDEVVGEWRTGDGPELAGALSGAAIERAVALAIAGEV